MEYGLFFESCVERSFQKIAPIYSSAKRYITPLSALSPQSLYISLLESGLWLDPSADEPNCGSDIAPPALVVIPAHTWHRGSVVSDKHYTAV
jgi:hypothetical protein